MGLSQADTITSADQVVIWKTGDSNYRALPYDDLVTALESSLTGDATQNGPRTINNLAVSVAIATNALTINLNQGDGVTAPTSTSGSELSFGTTNTDAASFTTPAVTSRVSLTIPAGATLGMANNVLDNIYVYAINNSGNIELAVSTEHLWGEDLLWSTTTMTTGATSRVTLYSAIARTSIPIRLIAKVTLTEATAGQYATMPSNVESVLGTRSGVIFNAVLQASPTSLTTNTPINIASITLPPGIWDISAGFGFIPGVTTSTTDLVVGVSTTSATLPSATIIGNLPGESDVSYRDRIAHLSPTVWASTSPITGKVPEYRHIRSVSGTVYLVIQATFTVSTLTGFGWLQARKVS